jgi:hypothetical protein
MTDKRLIYVKFSTRFKKTKYHGYEHGMIKWMLNNFMIDEITNTIDSINLEKNIENPVGYVKSILECELNKEKVSDIIGEIVRNKRV